MTLSNPLAYNAIFIVFVFCSGVFGIAQSSDKWIDPLNPPQDLIIKGSEQPELIPLSLCYNVFFRTLAQEARMGEDGYESAKFLIMKTGVGPQSIDKLLAVALDYDERVSAIDIEAEAVKDRYARERSAKAAASLQRLDERKNSEATALLHMNAEAVGAQEAQLIHRYIEEVVRRRVVIGGADAAKALNSRLRQHAHREDH